MNSPSFLINENEGETFEEIGIAHSFSFNVKILELTEENESLNEELKQNKVIIKLIYLNKRLVFFFNLSSNLNPSKN